MTIRSLILSSALALAFGAPAFAQSAFVLDSGEPEAIQAPAPRAEVTLDSAENDELKSLILDTLVANPDVLVQALTLINAKQVEARAAIEARNAHIRDVAENAIGAPVSGNPNGDVTIVFFSDYNCAECRAANVALNEVVASDSNLRIVHREMPMNGEDSQLAAKAALAADMQGRYKAFHDGLLAVGEDVGTQDVLKVALEQGIDLNKLLVDQDKPEVGVQLEDSRQLATDFGFQGAPAFFIGTFVATGQPSVSDLQNAIAQERARAAGNITVSDIADES